ncbi:unnamed protein product [Prunus brigantina]
MHQQEVPFVNVFLEGLKSDLEALARTQTSSFADQAQLKMLCFVGLWRDVLFAGQKDVAHDPVPNLESTGFYSGVIVLGDTLFVGDVAHIGLVTKLVNEVEFGIQSLLDDFVHNFDLAIGLRMG